VGVDTQGPAAGSVTAGGRLFGGPGGNVSRPGRIQPAKWELPRGGTAYQCGLLLH